MCARVYVCVYVCLCVMWSCCGDCETIARRTHGTLGHTYEGRGQCRMHALTNLQGTTDCRKRVGPARCSVYACKWVAAAGRQSCGRMLALPLPLQSAAGLPGKRTNKSMLWKAVGAVRLRLRRIHGACAIARALRLAS